MVATAETTVTRAAGTVPRPLRGTGIGWLIAPTGIWVSTWPSDSGSSSGRIQPRSPPSAAVEASENWRA